MRPIIKKKRIDPRYFLDETEEEVIICRSLSSDKGLEGRFHIPKDCIKKTKTIKK